MDEDHGIFDGVGVADILVFEIDLHKISQYTCYV